MISILKNSLVCNNASDDDDEPNRLCIMCPIPSPSKLLRLHSSNVSSSSLHEKMHSCTGCNCLTFLHCAFPSPPNLPNFWGFNLKDSRLRTECDSIAGLWLLTMRCKIHTPMCTRHQCILRKLGWKQWTQWMHYIQQLKSTEKQCLHVSTLWVYCMKHLMQTLH